MASQAKDRDAKTVFIELVRRRQELARQKEDLQRNRNQAARFKLSHNPLCELCSLSRRVYPAKMLGRGDQDQGTRFILLSPDCLQKQVR